MGIFFNCSARFNVRQVIRAIFRQMEHSCVTSVMRQYQDALSVPTLLHASKVVQTKCTPVLSAQVLEFVIYVLLEYLFKVVAPMSLTAVQ